MPIIRYMDPLDFVRRTPKGSPHRSTCPIASLLDIVGDKWTLLVVRDLLAGRTRYAELMRNPEGIATNILADRLRRLEKMGIVVRKPYLSNPPRDEYHLTDMGRDLERLLRECMRWGFEHLPHTNPKSNHS